MKKLLAVALAVAMLLGMVSIASAEEPVVLKVASIWSAESEANRAPMLKTLAEFEEAHPEIKLEVEWYEANAWKDQGETLALSDSLPDVFYWNAGGVLWNLVSTGDILALNDYLTDDIKDQLIGGAGEATVLARVGEGIVTTVGSAEKHSEVLENPDDISKVVLEKGLDSGTAYEIISIDIADIDIGRNIGANLQSLQAEANTKIAQAKAEERRAMAVALEQEMKAEVVKAQSDVVKAEAEVPRAMAEALRSGNIGVLDYYKLKNVQADTKMKTDIGNGVTGFVDSKKDK